MQLFGRHICRTFEEQPFGRLFLFPQLRVSTLGVKVFAIPSKEADKFKGYRTPPPPQKRVSYATLSSTPEVVFNGPIPKLVLDIEDDGLIVPDLQATIPKEKDAPGILFIGKTKRFLSVVHGKDRDIGHINLATGEFERDLVMNEEIAIASWRVVLVKPTDVIELLGSAPPSDRPVRLPEALQVGS